MIDQLTLERLPKSLLQTLPKRPLDIFPLRLSAFEKYLIWDETPDQPMNSFFELHFLDPLQVAVMEDAIAAAIQVHPMLACTIKHRDGELYWIHDAGFRPKLLNEFLQAPLKSAKPFAIDLTKEPGVRIWYRQDQQGRSRLLIQLHHATADGVGMRRFLIDALILYAQATGPESVDIGFRQPWDKIDSALLTRRADFSDTFGSPPASPLTPWQRIQNACDFHFKLPKPLRTPAPSASDVPSSTEADRCEPLEHMIFDRSTSEAILERARKSEIGINELSLALLFETCCLWNQKHGDNNPRSRLRILMPYDLRSRIDLRMSATNRLSFSFLGRTQGECRNLPQQIRSIATEIQLMKDTHLPLDLLAALESASHYPRLMQWAIRRSRRMATAVLTYAGDVSRGIHKYFPEQDGARIVGNTRLDKILAAPPVRENTHWSLGLCINWGQLCISSAWNREALSRQQCVDLLKLYESRWIAWLNS